MSASQDPRKQVGASVLTLATNVTHLKECQRLFGSNAKSHLLKGIVLEVVFDTSQPRTKTFIDVE